MYYNIIYCSFKYIIEILYTLFYLFYYQIISIFTDQIYEEDIVFFCGYGNIPGEKNKWDSETCLMGGSENCLIYLTEKLSKKYKVKVYNNCSKNKIINGVFYKHTKYFNYNNKYKQVIFWRFPIPLLFSNLSNINKKIVWMHDGEPLCKVIEKITNYKCINYLKNRFINNINFLVSPSKFLYNEINKFINIKDKHVVIPNFVHKSFNIKKYKVDKKILWHINFNRGLDIILKKWNDIRKIDSEIELHIYGNKDELYLNRNYYDNFNLTGVYFHNKLSHFDIINIIPHFKYFLYPAKIRESFSISTWECLINNCIPIVYDNGAIREIKDYGGIVVPDNNFNSMIDKLKELLDTENYKKKIDNINNQDFSFLSKDNIISRWSEILN